MSGPRRGAMLGERLDGGRNRLRTMDSVLSMGVMKLQLHLSGVNLHKLDNVRGTTDDYYCVVDVSKRGTNDWKRVGKTEVMYNSSSPSWPKDFSVEYSFSVAQMLRFQIHRLDEAGERKTTLLAEAKCSVAHLVVSEGQYATLPLEMVHRRRPRVEPRQTPRLMVQVEEERGDIGDFVNMRIAVQGVKGRRLFFTISREDEQRSGEYRPVVYSEVLREYNKFKANLFKQMSVSVKKLCNGDMDRELRLEFSDYDRKGNHKKCGMASFSLNSLKKTEAEGNALKFVLKREESKMLFLKSFQKSGVAQLVKFDITSSYTFLDYIRAGVEINLMIAVDMSSSNGDPRVPSSLQNNNRDIPNDYVVAMREVGAVLAQYDTDGKFPAYGFSACLPPNYETLSNCFALSGDTNDPTANGIEGVVEKYYDALDVVAPHQPCYLNPVISHCVEDCAKKDESTYHTTYTVLLLITDGVYQDQGRVADTISTACDLPLSLVIVGVGADESKFKLLDQLDGDTVRLCNSQGVPASRDIVQFVPFEKHRDDPARLAKETLEEIPTQLIDYFRSKGLKPDDVRAIRESLAQNLDPTELAISTDHLDIIEPTESYDSDWSDATVMSVATGGYGDSFTPPPSDIAPFMPPEDRMDSSRLKNAAYSTFELSLDDVDNDEKMYKYMNEEKMYEEMVDQKIPMAKERPNK